jgi:hypothetical protein
MNKNEYMREYGVKGRGVGICLVLSLAPYLDATFFSFLLFSH